MATPKLPRAGHIAGCIGLIALKHNDENAVEKATKIIRNDRNAVLDAAAEVVEGRIEAYIDAVPNAMKKTIDLRNSVLSDAAAEIRKLKEGD